MFSPPIDPCPLASSDRISSLSPLGNYEAPIIQDPTSGEWFISHAPSARKVLRDPGAEQAGFEADAAPIIRGLRAILYLSGERHRELRRNVAKLFSPKTTREKYLPLMRREATRVIELLRSTGQSLDSVSMEYSVAVAREIVGVTESPIEHLSARLDAMFVENTPKSRVSRFVHRHVQSVRFAHFFFKDVRPAIKARKTSPREDLISLLIEKEYPAVAIALECITYAAAGMVTTREFISLAAWQMLRNDALREEYLQSDEKSRLRLLTEMLRLDPIVRGLSRDLTQDLRLEVEGQEYLIPAQSRVHLCVPDLNTDEEVVGDCPMKLERSRTLRHGFPDDVLSFGAGPHRCPGAAIAMQESDILLHALMSQPVQLEKVPNVDIEPVASSLRLRDLRVRFN